jgi:hypothetical protein
VRATLGSTHRIIFKPLLGTVNVSNWRKNASRLRLKKEDVCHWALVLLGFRSGNCRVTEIAFFIDARVRPAVQISGLPRFISASAGIESCPAWLADESDRCRMRGRWIANGGGTLNVLTGSSDGLGLAPYLLTASIEPPDRLVYLSSGMHTSGDARLDDAQWTARRWNGSQAYADSKLFDVVLAFSLAPRWRGVLSNALEPGWVPTKMGGAGAPDDLSLAPVTQAWLAVSDDPAAIVGPVLLPSETPSRASCRGTHGRPEKTARLLRGSHEHAAPKPFDVTFLLLSASVGGTLAPAVSARVVDAYGAYGGIVTAACCRSRRVRLWAEVAA